MTWVGVLLVAAVVLGGLGLAAAIWWELITLRPPEPAQWERAQQRAETLLRESLSARQYGQLREQGYLEVPSRLHPDRRYRIPRAPGQVQVYEGGRAVGALCLVARDPVPQADLLLTLKWLIEGDEQAYLATANWIDGPTPLERLWGIRLPRLANR
jgi:hypothetical protein